MSLAEARGDTGTVGMWPHGAGYVDDEFVPIEEAKIPVTDWGFTRSDVTYDVVHVWNGAFFRLGDHLDRFEASMAGLRLSVEHDREALAGILAECVRRTGLRKAYVSMACVRGRPKPGELLHPVNCRNRLICYVLPWVWVMPPEMQARGAHLIIATTPRIPAACVDPTIKNYHWGDLTRGLFEAHDAGADNCVLLDLDGNVTEGPGFNVFMVRDGTVHSPGGGALEGITRMTVFELCEELGLPMRVGPIPADQFRDADEIFCATTAGGIMPASRIDGRILGNDRPGPVSAKLRALYWQKHEEGWHATPIDYS